MSAQQESAPPAGPAADRRRGRPARVGAATIADAVLVIGVEQATMQGVARHVGLSVPGLYHHVRGRDDLLRLAAERALSRTEQPVYDGEHWSDWLRRCAWYIRSAFASHPALLEQFVSGVIDDDVQLEMVDHALEALCQNGFTPEQALTTWAAVTAVALGSAVEQTREQRKVGEGRSWPVRILAAAARRKRATFAVLPEVATQDPYDDGAFDERLTLILTGIATRYGFDLSDGIGRRDGGTSEYVEQRDR